MGHAFVLAGTAPRGNVRQTRSKSALAELYLFPVSALRTSCGAAFYQFIAQ
jgi:hypothetical protein